MESDLRVEPDLRVESDLSVDHTPDAVVEDSVTHDVLVEDQGSFTVARCTCGWRSYARRSRDLARSEGADHVILYAGPTDA